MAQPIHSGSPQPQGRAIIVTPRTSMMPMRTYWSETPDLRAYSRTKSSRVTGTSLDISRDDIMRVRTFIDLFNYSLAGRAATQSSRTSLVDFAHKQIEDFTRDRRRTT